MQKEKVFFTRWAIIVLQGKHSLNLKDVKTKQELTSNIICIKVYLFQIIHHRTKLCSPEQLLIYHSTTFCKIYISLQFSINLTFITFYPCQIAVKRGQPFTIHIFSFKLFSFSFNFWTLVQVTTEIQLMTVKWYLILRKKKIINVQSVKICNCLFFQYCNNNFVLFCSHHIVFKLKKFSLLFLVFIMGS